MTFSNNIADLPAATTTTPADHHQRIAPSRHSNTHELWGGIECTFNRVHDRYFSQLAWSGHLTRPDDLDRFAALGIRALRYPVIWEMLAPDNPGTIHWTFADQRLTHLKRLGIRPIANLVHHGSGPRYAPIHSPAFARGLARFARRVAQRFPWLDAYTPVNEPLTTARFCGLYAVWYPHASDHRSFVRIVANQCAATILAMRAIRAVNPAAQLVQTDDLGLIYSTPTMAYEAAYQNHRRWLAWDLIAGKVGTNHPLRPYLIRYGLTEKELHWFEDNRCTIDLIGINHYPTSDRYLDEDIAHYPNVIPADNGRHLHADVEAVRVRPDPPGGFYERLMEAWHRYHLPLAITESHLGCTREEQIRWFFESWHAAHCAQHDGAAVRAVTAWSLLGAFNWNTLVTHDADYYEPGVFDIRSGTPRPTAIASLLRMLGAGSHPNHPALQHPGWWHRPERLFAPTLASQSCLRPNPHARKLLVLGAAGTLGRALVAACHARHLPCHALTHADLDLTDKEAVARQVREIQPWAVINASGYVRVDEAEHDPTTCFAINTEAAAALASICHRMGTALLCFSSDLVFDGRRHAPYLESHPRAPLNTYGRSKAAMEHRVLRAAPRALIARTSAFFSPDDDYNLITRSLRTLTRGDHVWLADDAIVSPTYVPDLVCAALDLLIDGAHGVWHLANNGHHSWADLVRQAATACHVSTHRLHGCSQNELNQYAPRPLFSALGTEKGQMLPPFGHALDRYAKTMRF